ncbi:MAG: DUF624 domain-containing protein [Lachnospiraceae bacterium]|nr:DUF624 domain-containing protein [Lachnospiraceae bacterium]
MGEILSSFLSNDSRFGKLMTRCGVIIGGNLMFILFSMPVLTAGAAYTALHFVMLKALRGDGQINPFRTFWAGFKENFLQATVSFIGTALFFLFLYADLRLCRAAGGALDFIRYPVIAIGVIAAVLALYLFPVMAAFKDTIPHLLRNALYFAAKKIYKVPVILFFNIFPLYLTYTDPQMMPLYAFLWVFFGFGAVAMLNSYLLLPEMKPFLPRVDEYGDFIADDEDEAEEGADVPEGGADGREDRFAAESVGRGSGAPALTEEEQARQALEDMKRLGM